MSQDRLEEAFAPLRERTSPAHLRTQPVRVRPAKVRAKILVAVGAMEMAAAIVTMWPRPASAAGLLAQAGKAFTGHAVIYNVESTGKRIRIGEGWYAPGRSRLQFKRGDALAYIRVYNGPKQQELIWDPESNRITLRTGVKEDRVTEMPSELDPQSLAMMVKDFKPKGEMNLKLKPATLVGKPAQRLDVDFGDRTLRLYGDAKDLRLIGYETVFKLPQGKTRMEQVLLSPERPTEKDLTSNVTYNGRTFDPFAEKIRIGESMETPLSVDEVEGKRIAIRKVAMNSRHDLFVLYTGVFGKYGENYVPTEIRDDAGGKYIRMPGFSPYGKGFTDGTPYTYDRKPLEGMHFMREGRGSPTKVSIGFRKEFKKDVVFRREFAVKPASGPLLEFFPFMALSPLNERDLRRTEAFIKRHRVENAKRLGP